MKKEVENDKNIASKFHHYLFTILVGLIVTVFLIISTYYVDNTTYITANGLYKAEFLEDALVGKNYFDINHVLYTDIVTYVWKILRINNWPGTILIKMAVVNSIAAGITISFLSLIVWHLTKRIKIVVLITAVYLFSAYFFFLSVSSEDIMPSLLAFVAAIYFFILFLSNNKNWFLIIFSSVSFTISFLLHRTMIIAYPAFLISLIFIPIADKKTPFIIKFLPFKSSFKKIYHLFVASFLFLAYSFLTVLILGKHPSIVLLTGPGNLGWSGFSSEKIAFTFLSGIGQSLLYGKNLSSLNEVLSLNNLVYEIPILIIIVLIFLKLVNSAVKNIKLRPLAILLILSFTLFEVMNLRYQGQDAQFQMAPLAIIPIGLAIISSTTSKKFEKRFVNLLILIAIIVLVINLKKAFDIKGSDTAEIKYFKEVANTIDPNKTVFVTHGFDQLHSWGRFIWGIDYPDDLIGMVSYPVNEPDLSPDQTAQKMLEFVNNSSKRGKQVITNQVITLSDSDLSAQMATVDSSGKGVAIKNAILINYDLELVLKTERDSFYRLVSKKSL